MADVQKPVETTQEAPAVETKVEETPAAPTTTTAEAAAEPAAPAAETEAPAAEATAAEEPAKKEEATPIEEGNLEHKGSNFPKNILFSKKYFWFQSEPFNTKESSTFKHDKITDVAHHVTAWAAETGKGLLFYSEKSDKTAPQGAIQLSEASDPTVEGPNKFHFTSKGHKHTFKAASLAERDNWVSQLKLKIAEAKDLVTSIPESETYKSTLASLKPAPAPVKAAEPTSEATAAETAAPAEAAPATETLAAEDTKRRSASRKRGSIFGTLLGKKEEKAAEAPAAETSEAAPTAEAETAPAAEPAAEPAVETPAVAEETPAVAETAAPAEAKETKPTPTKRASIFGNLLRQKKSPETETAAPAVAAAPATEETSATTEPVSETAPVIPTVETTAPLSAEIASPATVPTETVEVAPATNGETKKEVKSEKRKSSLPFNLGLKKSPASDEEGEKSTKTSPFSKLRATIKGKGRSEKAAEKAEEKPAEAETEAAKEGEPATEEAAKPVETDVAAPAAVAAPTTEEAVPVEKPIASTPAIPAAA